jgi:hypothetical protein
VLVLHGPFPIVKMLFEGKEHEKSFTEGAHQWRECMQELIVCWVRIQALTMVRWQGGAHWNCQPLWDPRTAASIPHNQYMTPESHFSRGQPFAR